MDKILHEIANLISSEEKRSIIGISGHVLFWGLMYA